MRIIPLTNKVIYSIVLSVTSAATVFAQNGGFPTSVALYGTVNILLGNVNGLVAVTDSMLSNNAGNVHTPGGAKLFKIDDQTICTMAGAYKTPGAHSNLSLEFNVPQVMSEFKTKLVSYDTFEEKTGRLARFFEFRFTASLQHLVSNGGDVNSIEPLNLTVAGFDSDGSLKVAEITLRPSEDDTGAKAIFTVRNKRPQEPLLTCEISVGLEALSGPRSAESNLRIRKMGKSFFCEAVGINEVAEDALANPAKYLTLRGIDAYISFLNGGPALSIDQLELLATSLAEETSRQEARTGKLRVGGVIPVAVLKNNRVERFTENPEAKSPSPITGTALGSSQASQMFMHCKNPGVQGAITEDFESMHPLSEHLIDCEQSLDGFDIHNSVFEQSRLSFSGKGDFLFDKSNVVTDSTLTLDPHIDVSFPVIKSLVCNFDWKSVIQNGNDIRQRTCGKNREDRVN